MEVLGDGSWLSVILEVACVDLLLGLDNALLIALVCRRLRPEHRVEALVFGAAGAVLFRALLAAGVGLLLQVPLLHLAGGVMLFLVALGLAAPGAPTRTAASAGGSTDAVRSLGAGIGLVILADAVMSLDNVLAVGAIARGHTAFTLIGLAASVPLVMFGGLLLSRVLDRARALATVGALVIGWISGDLVVTDPLLAGWATSQAPAWFLVVPMMTALYIGIDRYWRSRDLRRDAQRPVALG